jgi:hypothetical protein
MDNDWFTIPGRAAARELGTVQRVTLASGRRVLMCSGISASATQGAASYVCRSWRNLKQHFSDDDFLVVLSFPGQQADSPQVREPEVLRDFERRRPTVSVPT